MKEDPEYGVDSRYKSNKERKSDATALMEARLKRMKNVSKKQIIHAKLIQLKLKMEEFLKEPVYDHRNHFSEFLRMYIDGIYTKRSRFAKDMSITPILLSQIINDHRAPKEEFILKLMIHSEIVYKTIGEFQKNIWYKVYFQDKISKTMANQEKWRPEIEKLVKVSDPIEEYKSHNK